MELSSDHLIVGAGPTAGLEQLAADALTDCAEYAEQAFRYALALAEHRARAARPLNITSPTSP